MRLPASLDGVGRGAWSGDRVVLSVVVAAALGASGACYSPQPEAGSPCAKAPCPSGLVCAPATLTCELPSSTDAFVDGMLNVSDGSTDGSPPPQPDVTLQQQATAHVDSGDTVTAVLPMPPKPGHVLVMVGGTPAGPLQIVTGGGVTWARAAASTANLNVEIWYGVTDGSSGAVTITVPGSTSAPTMWLGEWSGLQTPVVIDGTAAASGASSPASAGTVVPGPAGDLVLFAVSDGSPCTFGSPPGNWTELAPIVSPSTFQSEWFRVGDVGSNQSPRVSETAHRWASALVEFQRSTTTPP